MASPTAVEVYVTPDSGLILMIWYNGRPRPGLLSPLHLLSKGTA